MRSSPQQSSRPRRHLWSWLTAVVLLSSAAPAHAQYGAPELSSTVPGEDYRIEVAGTFWKPSVFGEISVADDNFDIIGSNISFVDDLGYEATRFKDLRIVLRPTRKAKFRIQYTPITYQAETTLPREVIFNGQKFPVSVPIQSRFDWKVWRFAYEYDVFYRPRGYVGVVLEGRYTEMTARLASPLASEFTKARAPLPAIGIVGRGYVIPEVAVNFEMTMFRVPEGTIEDVEANYYDWDVYGTVNLNRYVGLQVGWRRMTNFLKLENDMGDTKFQGLWFGGALRY